MRINHNLASLNIYKNYIKELDSQSVSLNRISSGIKINAAKDGVNELSKSERFRNQVRSMQIAARNSQDGISLIQVAESGVDSVNKALQRIRELVVSSGGATSEDDKGVIQDEIEQLKNAIDGFANNTDFNGIKPLKKADVVKMPVGANSGEVIEVPFYNLNSSNLAGGTGTVRDINITNKVPNTSLDEALNILDSALTTVNDYSSKYGAITNRFQSCYNDLNEFSERLEGAESSIRDTDIAEEMMNYTKDSLLINASQAMLVQTNRFPQDILRILENVRSR